MVGYRHSVRSWQSLSLSGFDHTSKCHPGKLILGRTKVVELTSIGLQSRGLTKGWNSLLGPFSEVLYLREWNWRNS